MSRELLRRAMVALQHAAEARTVEYQARHADEARVAFECAVRMARARFEHAESRSSHAARVIARHAVALEMDELQAFETRLVQIEERIAETITAKIDPRDYRRLRLAD